MKILGTAVLIAFASATLADIGECRKNVTTTCLADVAWTLAAREKNGVALAETARYFAQLEQWDRADKIVQKIPEADFFRRSATGRVQAERLARSISHGKDPGLDALSDAAIFHWASARLVGYRDRRGGRIANAFGNGQPLPAPKQLIHALQIRWERVVPADNAFQNERLAESWFLLGDTHRAKAILAKTKWKPDRLGRKAVELFLDLGQPDRALKLLDELADPKYRGFYRGLIGRWYLERGDRAAAASVGLQGLDQAVRAYRFDDLPQISSLIHDAGNGPKTDAALRAAEAAAQQPGAFQSFNLSDVGHAYGAAGYPNDCLRLQLKARSSRPGDNEVVGSGLISGPVTYGGRWNLDGELANKTAAISALCGRHDEVASLDNRNLGLWYCDLRRHGAVSPKELKAGGRSGKEAYAVLLDRAAECHLQMGEREIGLEILREAITIATMQNDFRMLRSAAELAHTFLGPDLRKEYLRRTSVAVLNSAGQNKIPAREAAEFAYIWNVWGPSNGN